MKIVLAEKLTAHNDEIARSNRQHLDSAHVLALNFIGSPGTGKTSLLERTLHTRSPHQRMGVIEGDLFTARDAERIASHGIPVVQINTRGACHLDAAMVSRALSGIDLATVDLLLIENVGNLVCPAGCDLGEHVRVTVLSVTEGSDKPAKYPLVFCRSDAVVLTKLDLLDHTDFDLDAAVHDIHALNPDCEVFLTSARTGQGMERWSQWLSGLLR